jgi:hypothetical protein
MQYRSIAVSQYQLRREYALVPGVWIFGAIRLGQQLPEVNAVVSIVILLTIIPVVLAARLAGAGSVSRAGAAAAAVTATGAGG